MSKVSEAEWWSAGVVALKKKVLLSVSERYSAFRSPFSVTFGVHYLASGVKKLVQTGAKQCNLVQTTENDFQEG